MEFLKRWGRGSSQTFCGENNMKLNLILISAIFLLPITISAVETQGLGAVKVQEVKYVSDGTFLVTLSSESEAQNTFEFKPDELDGVLACSTPSETITRMDITLSGSDFINLLILKMSKNETINISCGFKETTDDGKLKLSYFQVNQSKK
jgi:hypothetical protein